MDELCVWWWDARTHIESMWSINEWLFEWCMYSVSLINQSVDIQMKAISYTAKIISILTMTERESIMSTLGICVWLEDYIDSILNSILSRQDAKSMCTLLACLLRENGLTEQELNDWLRRMIEFVTHLLRNDYDK